MNAKNGKNPAGTVAALNGSASPACRQAGARHSRSLLVKFIYFAVSLFALSLSVRAEVPAKITYQGNIRQNGNLVTGQRNMTFKIYPSSTSLSPLWTSGEYLVSISTGVFKVDLAPDLSPVNWENGSLWLELVIGGVPLSPRDELTSSPYSVNSLLHSGKRYTSAAAPPSSPSLGDLWMDGSTNMFRYWNGTVWTGGGTGGGMPDPHAYTHVGGGSDPLTALGTHSVTGPVSFAAGADMRAGAGAAAIYVSTNLVISGAVNLAGVLTVSSVTVTDGRGLWSARQDYAAGVSLSSASASQYGGIYVSTHIYVSSNIYVGQNALYVGGGALNQVLKKSAAGYLQWGNDLGGVSGTGIQYRIPMWNSDTALTNSVLNQDGGLNSITLINGSTLTVSGAGGIYAGRHMFAGNVEISSETSAAFGAGIRISTNIYIVGFSSAAKFYGDGSALTGITVPGDNLGSHIATKDLNMAGFSLVNAGSITASSPITTYSSMTVAGSGFSVGGSTLVVTNGNVGIGAQNPQAKLEVSGGESPGDYIAIFKSGGKVAAWIIKE